MRALIGYAMLFMAIGILISYFISGFCEFIIVLVLLLSAYILLFRCRD
ncbi:MAG: hypothetical protein IJ167_08395 [Lachnospiraceae bacterium]|nr:hypothetical protein [Lachnospiraceae bacterium]